MNRPAIVLAHLDGMECFNAEDLAALGAAGEVLDAEALSRWDDPRADALLARAEVIVGHWGCPPIDGGLLDRAPNLGLIAYAAGTVKGTIAPEVMDRVRVTSGANANAAPVAEFTLAMILLANKNTFMARDLIRSPEQFDAVQDPAHPVGNFNKTIGIIGASLIGRRVIELLRPFPALNVAVYDPFLSAEEAAELGVAKMELNELCASSQIVSIHAPDLPSTRHMVGAEQLAAMPTGATLINTARGRLLDHDALTAEIAAGRLYAILDVTDPEPLPDGHLLRSSSNVFLTPHIAGSQGTELRRMSQYAAEEIRRYVAGEPGINVITRAQLDRLA